MLLTTDTRLCRIQHADRTRAIATATCRLGSNTTTRGSRVTGCAGYNVVVVCCGGRYNKNTTKDDSTKTTTVSFPTIKIPLSVNFTTIVSTMMVLLLVVVLFMVTTTVVTNTAGGAASAATTVTTTARCGGVATLNR